MGELAEARVGPDLAGADLFVDCSNRKNYPRSDRIVEDLNLCRSNEISHGTSYVQRGQAAPTHPRIKPIHYTGAEKI